MKSGLFDELLPEYGGEEEECPSCGVIFMNYDQEMCDKCSKEYEEYLNEVENNDE